MTKNDGQSMQNWPYPRAAVQDRTDFALGTCTAPPAPGYFADVAEVENEQVIADAVAGLSDAKEIHAALMKLFQNYYVTKEYMRRRMGIKT